MLEAICSIPSQDTGDPQYIVIQFFNVEIMRHAWDEIRREINFWVHVKLDIMVFYVQIVILAFLALVATICVLNAQKMLKMH